MTMRVTELPSLPKDAVQPSAVSPAISIVVIGRNEGQRLLRCLESIRSIRNIGGNLEVIYVDSCSTDDSRELAANCGARVIALECPRPTAAMGRNAGWRNAKADLVLFLDGDTILHPDFPSIARQAIHDDPQIAAVWGHRREIHPETSAYNRILDLDWIFPAGTVQYCGGDVLMPRLALEQTGGYDPELIAGEEPELCRRLRAEGYRILHVDAPMTGHDLQMTSFSQYWKRATRAGHAYAEVSARFRGTSEPFWEYERRANFTRGGFWILSFSIALAALLGGAGWLPLLIWFGLLAFLSVRSGWKARHKAPGKIWLLLLYGIHSHMQQIPIMIGQLRFDFDTFRGKKRNLIEYKQGTGL